MRPPETCPPPPRPPPDYLEHYTHHMPAGIQAYVDHVHNCEDLAMQMLVANATGEAPTFYHSPRWVAGGRGTRCVCGRVGTRWGVWGRGV